MGKSCQLREDFVEIWAERSKERVWVVPKLEVQMGCPMEMDRDHDTAQEKVLVSGDAAFENKDHYRSEITEELI